MESRRLVEESDFKATRELFGTEKKKEEKSIDTFIPKTEAEFEEFAELVADRVTPFNVCRSVAYEVIPSV